jgi:hypothetical protein
VGDADEQRRFRRSDHGLPRGTSMPAAFPVTGAPSIVRDRSGALSRALHGALSRLAGRHSGRACSSLCETATRPLLALLSQHGSRPRAPLRLLQVVVSTSTTTDHSDISIRGNPRSGRLPGLERKSPSVRGSRRSCSGSGAGPTDARHSRSRLLAPETSPQPRSLRAPGVARRHFPPVWSDAVGLVALPTSSALARSARR